MSSMSRRKFLVKHPVVVDVGCGCRRTKLSSFFSPSVPTKPKLNPHTPPKHHHPLSSYYPFSPSTNFSTTTSHNFSSSSTSPYEYSSSSPSWSTTVKKPPQVPKKKSATNSAGKAATTKGRVAKESVAVVKESEDPYHDFRDSMLQMILEKEIYTWDDLRDLLHRFLSLNSSYHHESILRAFTEIWNDVFSGTAPAKRAGGGGCCERKKQRHHHHQRGMSREEAWGAAA